MLITIGYILLALLCVFNGVYYYKARRRLSLVWWIILVICVVGYVLNAKGVI